jgi:hypothetical protein
MPASSAAPRPSRNTIVVTLLVIGLLAIAVIVRLLSNGGDLLSESATRCDATGNSYTLTPEQVSNAAAISAVALQRDLPERAVTIALATALQESKLKNLDYGDRDSVGLFQQRESQGWGAKNDLQDPEYAAGKFYDELVKVDNWQTRPLTEVAQAVQRSAYPDAYAKWETTAQSLSDALFGTTPASLTCQYDKPDPSVYDIPNESASTDLTPATATAALTKELPGRQVSTLDPTHIVVTAADAQSGWQSASWLVANSQRLGITAVSFDGKTWHKDKLEWKAESAALPTQVTATISSE